MYLDHHGEMTLLNVTNGDKSVITFKKKGWSKSEHCKVTGFVYNKEGVKK
jgi:hypothetical protein